MTTHVKSDYSEKTMLLENACIAIRKDGSCRIVDLSEIKECEENYYDLAELTKNPESFIDKMAHLNRKPHFNPVLFFQCIDDFQKENKVF